MYKTESFFLTFTITPRFNRTLIYQRGAAIGQEFRGKGVHAALGPMM